VVVLMVWEVVWVDGVYHYISLISFWGWRCGMMYLQPA
jgi:hypothetical protein